jgi:hypothetical protein
MGTLTIANIKAAAAIQKLMPSWDDADIGLERLREHFPSNTERSDVLVKASAIDKLYSTRAGNIYWVANAVVAAMEDAATPQANGERRTAVDIVDLVSQYKLEQHKDSHRCASFASKYCHFFVDASDFPIYDSFALAAVKDLLGGAQRDLTPHRSEYQDFCERVARLRARDGLGDVGVRELDRFLWLWGQWLFQRGRTKPAINIDVYNIFHSEKPEVRRLVDALKPRDE